MARKSKRAALVLTSEQRATLKALTTSRTATTRDIERAKVMLGYADGASITELKCLLGFSRATRCQDREHSRSHCSAVSQALPPYAKAEPSRDPRVANKHKCKSFRVIPFWPTLQLFPAFALKTSKPTFLNETPHLIMTTVRSSITTSEGINPHAVQPTSIVALGKSFWRNRQLIGQMTKREVVGRYKGSVMGLAWSFFNPVFMLLVYTFVFSEIFKSRWGAGDDSKTQFALVLFVGMIVLSLFSEVLNRAPGLILSNVNYVKKVVFPIEILPVITMGAALFHSLISLGVLLTAFALFNGYLHWTAVFTPLVLLPLVILTTGLAWMLASLGVFLRDVGQTISIITTVLMFLSPVFYPMTAVPERFRSIIMANPLTFIIEQAREVLIWGRLPNWLGLGIYTLAAVAVAWLGYAWFQKTRKGFADVL